MELTQVLIEKYSTNCYLLFNEDTKEMIVIDPGANGDRIYDKCAEMGGNVVAILLTHAHYDHITGVNKLRELTGAKVYANIEEKLSFKNSAVHMWNCEIVPDEFLKDGQVVSFGGMEFRAISTPGHTPGCMCFYFEKEGLLFSGDTLFCASVGRTDLPGGDTDDLISSVKNKLFVLPEETKVLPGHMGATTIAYEKKMNPFIR